MRMESDYEMSPAWILVPLIPLIGLIVILAVFFGSLFAFSTQLVAPAGSTALAGFIVALLGLVIILVVVGLVAQILYAYLLYKLVNRRNKHFQRHGFLYDDLMTMVRELGAKKGVDVSLMLNNMDRTSKEVRFDETEKSAALWAIITFALGILSYVSLGITAIALWIAVMYVYYFLMKDFYKHERREDMFLDDLNRSLMAVGVTINFPRRTLPIPDRSFILYLILSIITLGIFSIYWLYVLLTDPNGHFRQQALTEDTILAQVTPLMV